MVDLGNGAEADQVLDEAGKGGDVGHAGEDGDRGNALHWTRVVGGAGTNFGSRDRS